MGAGETTEGTGTHTGASMGAYSGAEDKDSDSPKQAGFLSPKRDERQPASSLLGAMRTNQTLTSGHVATCAPVGRCHRRLEAMCCPDLFLAAEHIAHADTILGF